MAADFAAGLVERDVAVVSGGAFGIDGAAHRATLAADGITVAVLAGGIDIPIRRPFRVCCTGYRRAGLLVTEYPPGVRPARHRFLTRNRLVAALSRHRGRGGRSAQWRGQHRVVGGCDGTGGVRRARPGHLGGLGGCHELLRGGATLVTRADEVVELVGHAGELAADAERPSSPLDGLGGNELRVYDALPARGARTTDEIAVASGLPPTQVLGPLSMLEIAGLVVCRGGRWKLALR